MAEKQPIVYLTDFPQIERRHLTTVQANLGYACNQTCFHCHVNAGPNRREIMTLETIEELLAFVARASVETLDLTGGAPELNPHFRHLVTRARALGVQVLDRCNLTILAQPGQDDLARFLASHRVGIVASLPCYLETNVDSQRGDGVFEASLAGLRQLNALGYGEPGSGLELDLVYNPLGAQLPPPQVELAAAYHQHLQAQYGIVFNRLFTITNMPINRFAKDLARKGQYHDYLQTLRDAHQHANLDQVMCRSLVSVDWKGYLYDCDFNQMLHLPLAAGNRPRTHLRDLELDRLPGGPIAVADHCYGCTAGQGSSCGGALEPATAVP